MQPKLALNFRYPGLALNAILSCIPGCWDYKPACTISYTLCSWEEKEEWKEAEGFKVIKL